MLSEEAEVDAKQAFANERTYVEWIEMATTLGGISIALLGLNFPAPGVKGFQSHTTPAQAIAKDNDVGTNGFGVELSKNMSHYVGMLLLPLAIMFGIYGMWLFADRRRSIHYNRGRDIADKIKATPGSAPVMLGITTGLVLTTIMILDLIKGF